MDENSGPADEKREKVILAGQEDRTGAQADFIASLFLMGIGVVAFVFAYRMPGFEHWGSYARPGFPPMFFSAMLTFGSILLLLRSLRDKGYRLEISAEKIRRFATETTTTRFVAILLMVAGYFALLNVREIHFVLKTAAFLFCSTYYYKAGGWRMCLLVAVVTSILVWSLFYLLFSVPLP